MKLTFPADCLCVTLGLFRETPQMLDLLYAQLLISLTTTLLRIPRVLESYILKDFSGPGWFCGLQIHIRGGGA